MGEEPTFGDVAVHALDALAIGVIVTDQQARRIYSNAAADRWLGTKFGALACPGGRVCATNAGTQMNLQMALSAVGRTSAATADRNHLLAPSPSDSNPDLAICILPFEAPESGTGPQAMWIVRAIERSCNLEMEAQRLFGLSKTEAKFASSIASGQSLNEAAKAHHVTLSTARSHMKNIFRKTGFSRQSQVAAMLRGAQIPV